MTLLKDLIHIPEQVHRGDFVLKWSAATPPDREQSNKTIAIAGDVVSGDITCGDWQCIASPSLAGELRDPVRIACIAPGCVYN